MSKLHKSEGDINISKQRDKWQDQNLDAETRSLLKEDEYRCVFGCGTRGGCDLVCADYVEYILEKEGDVAAVISEPIRSTPYIPKPQGGTEQTVPISYTLRLTT